MHSIYAVYLRELRGYFATPIIYVFTTIFLVIAGLLTFVNGGFFERGEANLSGPFFSWIPLLMALFAPAVGMRIWARENRLGTLDLLFSHPVQLQSLVLGKFLAALSALCAPLFLTVSFVFTVAYLGEPDYLILLSSYFGSVLVGAAFVAITCACSAVSRNQVISFVVSTALCLIIVLLGTSQLSNEMIVLLPGSRTAVDAISSLAIKPHFDGFRKGLIETRSLFYFITFIGAALLINYMTLLRKQR